MLSQYLIAVHIVNQFKEAQHLGWPHLKDGHVCCHGNLQGVGQSHRLYQSAFCATQQDQTCMYRLAAAFQKSERIKAQW